MPIRYNENKFSLVYSTVKQDTGCRQLLQFFSGIALEKQIITIASIFF